MMGVPLYSPSWVFGDNKSVITSSTIPHSMLNKRHHALSYHRVHEACAHCVQYMFHVTSPQNVADCLTKYLPYPKFWLLIAPVLYWKGETNQAP